MQIAVGCGGCLGNLHCPNATLEERVPSSGGGWRDGAGDSFKCSAYRVGLATPQRAEPIKLTNFIHYMCVSVSVSIWIWIHSYWHSQLAIKSLGESIWRHIPRDMSIMARLGLEVLFFHYFSLHLLLPALPPLLLHSFFFCLLRGKR